MLQQCHIADTSADLVLREKVGQGEKGASAAYLHCAMTSICNHCISLVVVLKLDIPKSVQFLIELLVEPELDVSKLVHILLKVELDIARRIHFLLKVEVEFSNIRQLLCILELDISNLALATIPTGSADLSQMLG